MSLLKPMVGQPSEFAMTPSPNYYDEAYFERGWERGTSYAGYKAAAAKSAIFHNIAEAVRSVFQPKRVLEIGCATGATVAHLNQMSIEAWGIDVSTWAVENRLHDNVLETPAHHLPFQDGYFDLIISAHSIEHIPVALKDDSFAEISRVGKGGLQFHMLPILGDGPYSGDEDWHRTQLQADPTHVLLHNRKWWLDEWRSVGWLDLPINVVLQHDTDQFELSSCQLVLRPQGIDTADLEHVVARASTWNRDVTRNLYVAGHRQPVISLSEGAAAKPITFEAEETWLDTEFASSSTDFQDVEILGTVDVDGTDAIYLRLALVTGSHSDSVVDSWQKFAPGRNLLSLHVEKLMEQSGVPDLTCVKRILFGGSARNATITVTLAASRRGAAVPLIAIESNS